MGLHFHVPGVSLLWCCNLGFIYDGLCCCRVNEWQLLLCSYYWWTEGNTINFLHLYLMHTHTYKMPFSFTKGFFFLLCENFLHNNNTSLDWMGKGEIGPIQLFFIFMFCSFVFFFPSITFSFSYSFELLWSTQILSRIYDLISLWKMKSLKYLKNSSYSLNLCFFLNHIPSLSPPEWQYMNFPELNLSLIGLLLTFQKHFAFQ